jgi:hypothetical protein
LRMIDKRDSYVCQRSSLSLHRRFIEQRESPSMTHDPAWDSPLSCYQRSNRPVMKARQQRVERHFQAQEVLTWDWLHVSDSP